MLDYVNVIGDGIAALISATGVLPTGTAKTNAGKRISGFQRDLYKGVGDDPTVLLEYRTGNLRNPTVTFNNVPIDFWLRGQVQFDIVIKTKRAGTDVVSNLMARINKAIWAAYPALGLSTTGLKIPTFQFNPSTTRRRREGDWTVFNAPLLVDVRVKKSVLTA